MIKTNDLTEQQELFCQYLAMGMSQLMAYKKSYGANYSNNAIRVDACRLASNPKIILRISELREELKNINTWEYLDSIDTLISVIENPESKPSEIIAAIKELNNMRGFNIDKKQIELKSESNIRTINIIKAEDINNDSD